MHLKLINNYREYEQQIYDFLIEYNKVKNERIPLPIWYEYEVFEHYCQYLESRSRGLGENVPSTLYFTLDEDRNMVVGAVDFRHYLNDRLLAYGGHIGDLVLPSERRKGIATAQISLALEKYREMGVEKVLITCEADNIGSAKSIINNGGTLENEVEAKGKIFQRYWVDLIKTQELVLTKEVI